MGTSNMFSFLHHDDAQVVAVCDVDSKHRDNAKRGAENHYAKNTDSGSFKGCPGYNDFRELIARDDIDALSLALPDHGHAIPVIMGARAGKDMYSEKPLGLTVEEGRFMVDTVRRHGVVFQTGTQLRSYSGCRFGCELVRNGRIGEVQTIYCSCGVGVAQKLMPEMPVPDGFDYERWLGPAPWAPYTELRCHRLYRWNLDYGGGQITDHGAHYCDLAQWAIGTELTSPVEFEGHGEFPKDGLYDTAISYHVECTYPNGIKMICTDKGKMGTTIVGTEGEVFVGDPGVYEAKPTSLGTSVIKPSETRLYDSRDHHQNFLDCVKTRAETVAPIEQAHRSATIGQIGNIAMKLGRKLTWDPVKERFLNDPDADRMLSRAMRLPWELY